MTRHRALSSRFYGGGGTAKRWRGPGCWSRPRMLKRNAYIGASVPRLEDFRFLTGRGIYAGDLRRDDLLP